MSTVKISQLPILTRLDSNTSNTILVGIDKETSVTSQFTAKILANGLYANTPLNVGNNQITFPGTVAQFAGNNENYLQINLQNKNGSGSSDFVVTANNGTDSTYYGDFGIAGSIDNDIVYSAILPLDTYLYAQGGGSGNPGGNLVIGTATTGKTINFISGGTSNTDFVAKLSTDGFQLLKKPLTFADGTTQNTSATETSTSAASFANSAFNRANASYGVSNTGSSFANGAFVTANAAASFSNGAFLRANSSYDQANSGASFANGAFVTANAVASFANGSFDKANSAGSFANGAFVTANSGASFANGAFVTANAAASFANGAFAAANSSSMAASFANGAFDRANAVFSQSNNYVWPQANSAASFANGAFVTANAAFLKANAGYDVANTGSSFANGAFVTANASYSSQNTTASFANGAFVTANSGASFANGAFVTANAAFTSANSGWSKANSAYSLAGTQAGRLDVIEPIAQAAFTNAASAVQNTATIQLETIRLSGNLIANSTSQGIFVDRITSNSAAFSRDVIILGNLTANTVLGNVFFSNIVTGKSVSNSIQWYPQYISPSQQDGQIWYSANTISLIQDTDVIGDRPAISKVLFERVYNNTGSTIPSGSWVKLAGGVTSNSVPYIQLADAGSAANSQVEGFIKVGIATGAYGFVYTRGIVSDFDASTFGNNGQMIFLSTIPGQATNVAPTGANSVVSVAKILSNGSANGKIQVGIGNQQAYGKPNGAVLFANNNLIQASNTATIDEANGTFYVPNGLLFNTRSYPSAQTAITLNFKTDTWVRANIAASLAVTLGNFVPGSDIVLFITNTSTGGGAAHTITHGCSALNSTVGATTFTLSGTTTARIKYYSFDSDLANTYASISFN
jgi:hypothetical protein